MTVIYRLEPVDGGSAHREVLLTERCPSCAADWRRPRAALPRPGGHRTFRCEECGEHHDAVRVDEHGVPAPSPGWGLAQENSAELTSTR